VVQPVKLVNKNLRLNVNMKISLIYDIIFCYHYMQVNIDGQAGLNTVHRLMECVAPSVFRPIDILLKVLFSKPPKLVRLISAYLLCTMFQCTVLLSSII